MQARVNVPFGDKTDGDKLYLAGEIYEGDDERIADLQSRGFVTPLAKPGVDFESLTVRELVAMCGEKGIEVPKKPRKAELIASLRSSK